MTGISATSSGGRLQPVHWLKIGFDLTSCFLLFLFFQSLKIFAKPYKSSFYCNDYSINMPFKRSTVTNGNLILIGIVFPFVLLAATELVRSLYVRRFPSPATSTRFVYKIRCLDRRILDVSEQFGNLYVNCGAFFFGLASVACVTDFVKVLVGRFRPNFLDVCQPNLDPYKDLCFKYNKTYLVPGVDFKCMSRDLPSIDESRLSFPSGHSSISFYSMLFLIMFIQHTWKCSRLGLMPRIVQLGLFSMAVFIALSRIVDNKHHPTDVIAGAALGTLGAVLTFRYLTDLLKKNNYRVVHCLPFTTPGGSSHQPASSSSTSATTATTRSHSLGNEDDEEDDEDYMESRTGERLIIVTSGGQSIMLAPANTTRKDDDVKTSTTDFNNTNSRFTV